jgi:hypothetical protein
VRPVTERTATSSELFRLRGIHIFALIFTAIFLLHGPLLRLPYFWDEAGYYIPAAYDFFTHGSLIPQSVPSNAHPPLPAIYLAFWWKLSAFKPSVTRIAMLLLAALALTAVFKLSQMLTNTRVALAVLACTAVYPVWFAQSSLAHADLPAAAFSLLGICFYFRSLVAADLTGQNPRLTFVSKAAAAVNRDTILGAALFWLSALSKETVVVIPIALAIYEVGAVWKTKRGVSAGTFARPVLLLSTVIPLGVWFLYHRLRTGFFFGNPEFFAYNVTGTFTPLRIVMSIGLRLWQILGYMNLWLLTLATIWVMRYPALSEDDGSERPRIALTFQYRIAGILIANVLAFSLVGGAALARYLLPVYPLVILIGISTLRRRLANWPSAVALVMAGFALALFANPFGYSASEDNLSYRDYVILHKQAASRLEERDPHARVLTAWTATDELTKPFLSYVRRPMSVVRIEDFSYDQLQIGRLAAGQYDVALLFSTKQTPQFSVLDRWSWWERLSRRYFGFHRDLSADIAAAMLGGRITWEAKRGRQWIAIVSFDRVEDAKRVGSDSRNKT